MNQSLKYTCLFGGGAIRGVSYIGTIKAFEELGVEFEALGGSSVGSVFAALLAIGYSSDEMKEIFSQVNFNLFRDISIGIGPLFAVSKGEVFHDWVRELIEKKFYGDKYQKGANRAVTFKDLNLNLTIITTDLANFKCKEFSKIETPDYEIASAIRISCCMPGLMKPIEYNNTLLVDGDLQKSWPMWRLSKNLTKTDNRILELRLEGYYEGNDISGIDYANAVYSCMTSCSTSFVKDIYGDKDKFDYIVLNTGDIVVVDFNMSEEKRNELIKSGYEQTIKYFRQDLPIKKAKIRECYKTIYRHTSQLQNYIEANKIYKAKNELADLFMDISDCIWIIDSVDINNLKSFKNKFIDSIKYPALFGKIKLKNELLIKTELKNINNHLSEKLKELNDYLSNFG